MDMLNSLLEIVRPKKDGDRTDRLSYFYSVVLLAAFAVFISGYTFVGKPIQCWFPAYYRDYWIQYALDYCFVQNTYFLPFTETKSDNYWTTQDHQVQIPVNVTQREQKLIGYYQWVPFILAIQAILFYIPIIIWRSLYEASGVKVKAICDTCSSSDNMDPTKRAENVRMVAKFMDSTRKVSEGLHGGKKSFFVGKYISTLFLVIKFLFAANCLGQFFMLQQFLGLKNFWWGADVLADLIAGREWPQTANFPRVTMCDFEIKRVGNVHRHTVQCVLLINMFNEKIFVFLWWWLLFVGVLSALSFVYWLVTMALGTSGQHIVLHHLKRLEPDVAKLPRRRKLVRRFMDGCLKTDGIFLLRLIATNSDEIVSGDLIKELWKSFKERNPDAIERINSEESKKPNKNKNKKADKDKNNVNLAGAGDYPTLPYPPPYEETKDGSVPRLTKRTPLDEETAL